MGKNLLIIGASGHGKVVADIALKMGRWESISFLDDNENILQVMGLEVIGKSSDVHQYVKDNDVFIGIGNNAVRKRIHTDLESKHASIPTLVHPTAIIGERVEIEPGTVVMAGAIINCCTSIGKGCIINTGAIVEHDNQVEDFVHLSPGVRLAGTVRVGEGTWLGIGSIVINNITITSESIIGAGAVVVRDIMMAGTYVGVPAKRLSS
ncbi:acetyltransferase [Paenibacillus albus]|uniref:Acetyltransferase n=1 Tax=Paenibacillus albus TaxID=2495582 RepID=A0A3S8ZYR0_9BACL|nr:acetyltransferase [Paenibacillus albus]AZN38588.1 acetyltransferase [Paenibacillus albus]